MAKYETQKNKRCLQPVVRAKALFSHMTAQQFLKSEATGDSWGKGSHRTGFYCNECDWLPSRWPLWAATHLGLIFSLRFRKRLQKNDSIRIRSLKLLCTVITDVHGKVECCIVNILRWVKFWDALGSRRKPLGQVSSEKASLATFTLRTSPPSLSGFWAIKAFIVSVVHLALSTYFAYIILEQKS